MKPSQIVKVRVMEVDLKRQRIALSMRLDSPDSAAPRRDAPARSADAGEAGRRQAGRRHPDTRQAGPGSREAPMNAMALAFAKLKK